MSSQLEKPCICTAKQLFSCWKNCLMIIIHKKTSTESVLSSSIYVHSQSLHSHFHFKYCTYHTVYMQLCHNQLSSITMDKPCTYVHGYQKGQRGPCAYLQAICLCSKACVGHTAVEIDSTVRHSRIYHHQYGKTTGNCQTQMQYDSYSMYNV